MARKRKEIEEEEDAAEITRCVCGRQELSPATVAKVPDADPGLFMQCDQCNVWQHGFCVGFDVAEDVPDIYYCELCRPDLHLVSGKSSKYLAGEPDEAKPQRRRSSSDKREPDDGDDDASRSRSEPKLSRRRWLLNSSREEEILKRVLQESAAEAAAAEAARNPDKPDGDSKADPREFKADSREVKAELKADSKAEIKSERDNQHPPKQEDTSETQTKREPLHEDPELDEPDEPVESSTAAAAATAETWASEHPDSSGGAESSTERAAPRRRRADKTRSPRKRQPARKPAAGPKRTKPRIPPPRSTLAEMRRRTHTILEFSGRAQLDMQSGASVYESMVEQLRQHNQQTQQIEALEKHHAKNLGLLEDLTRKLLAWQENYG